MTNPTQLARCPVCRTPLPHYWRDYIRTGMYHCDLCHGPKQVHRHPADMQAVAAVKVKPAKDGRRNNPGRPPKIETNRREIVALQDAVISRALALGRRTLGKQKRK